MNTMTEQTVWTVNRILQWTQQYFSGKGLENPRLDAEVLLCDVLGCRRIDLFMRLQQELSQEELKQYRDYVLRRAAWEPLAYIIGRKAFLQWVTENFVEAPNALSLCFQKAKEGEASLPTEEEFIALQKSMDIFEVGREGLTSLDQEKRLVLPIFEIQRN